MKSIKVDKALFVKFAEGKCTREEVQAIIQYLQSTGSSEDFPTIEELDFELPEMSRAEAENVFRKLKVETSREVPKPKRYWITQHWYKAAAVFIGILMVTAVYRFYFADERVHYTTNYGETRDIELADGTSVTLNANSSLSFKPSSFRENGQSDQPYREVWLEGEAFFHVRRQADSTKFMVHTERLVVEVLGTQFNVKHRRGKTEVVLATGKVKLKTIDMTNPQEMEMEPGEFVTLQRDEEAFSRRQVDPDQYSSWRENKFIFEDQRLDEIALFIEDYYGMDVIINDSDLAGRKFTGSAPADSLDILLDKLVTLFGFQLAKEENKVIFD